MDPKTLNLNLEPDFWLNLDQDPGLCSQYRKKLIKKTILEKNNFKQNLFFQEYEYNVTRKTF